MLEFRTVPPPKHGLLDHIVAFIVIVATLGLAYAWWSDNEALGWLSVCAMMATVPLSLFRKN